MEALTRRLSAGTNTAEAVSLGLMISDPGLNAQVLNCLREQPVRVVLEMPGAGSATEAQIESEVRRASPDVAILEVAAAGERFPAVIRLLRSLPAPPAVITIHAVAAPDALLAAIRAGAADCLYLPLAEGALRQIVDRVAGERSQTLVRRPPAKTLGFLSVTGGCGSTLLACHVAGEFRRLGAQDLLLADFDVVSGMIGFWMRATNGYSIRDAVRGLQRLDVSFWRGLVSTVQPHLDVLSAPQEIVSGDEYSSDQLLKVLRFARSHYEWVLADLGAGLTPAALRLLGEIDTLIAVATAEVAALFQARRTLGKLTALGFTPERVRLVLNRLNKQQQIRPGEAERALGWPIDAVLPEDREKVEEAQGEGRLVSSKSELGKRIAEMTGRILGQPPAEKSRSWTSIFRAAKPREA